MSEKKLDKKDLFEKMIYAELRKIDIPVKKIEYKMDFNIREFKVEFSEN